MQQSNVTGYSATYPTRYAVKPRQPIAGKFIVTTIVTIFQYDIISPYGYGAFVVSNPDTVSQVMPGWGMIVRLSILAPGPATLTIQTDLVDGTFTEVESSPIAIVTNAKVQVFTIQVLPCFVIRGRLSGDGSTYTYHASLTDY